MLPCVSMVVVVLLKFEPQKHTNSFLLYSSIVYVMQVSVYTFDITVGVHNCRTDVVTNSSTRFSGPI